MIGKKVVIFDSDQIYPNYKDLLVLNNISKDTIGKWAEYERATDGTTGVIISVLQEATISNGDTDNIYLVEVEDEDSVYIVHEDGLKLRV